MSLGSPIFFALHRNLSFHRQQTGTAKVAPIPPAGSSTVKASAIHVYDVYEGGEISIVNNTITNADQGIAIYKYTYNTVMNEYWWEGPTSGNDIVTISGNSISGFTKFGIATSKLNNEDNAQNETLVAITGNDLTSSSPSTPISIEQSGSNWSVSNTGNTFNGLAIS